MLVMNTDFYKKMSRDEALERYDWGYEVQGTVLVCDGDNYKVFIAQTLDGEWCCEIEGWETYQGERFWNMLGQGFGETACKALDAAVVECVGYDVMREDGNCEDAVNGIAYEAYQYAYGSTPMIEMDSRLVDGFMGIAREFVKEHGKQFGIEWEEF